MGKQTKITITLDSPLYEESENIIRNILAQRMAFGYYANFNQNCVKVEEIYVSKEEPLMFKNRLSYQDLAKEINKIDWCELQTGGDGSAGIHWELVENELLQLPHGKAIRLLMAVIEADFLSSAYPEEDSPFKDMKEFKNINV